MVEMYRRVSAVPLQGRYPAAVALALLALSPFIVVSSATLLFEQQLMHDLDSGRLGVSLSSGLANAGYAFGAVAAADLIQRMSGRRLFLTCEAVFVAASLLAALAPGITAFTVGRVVQGLTTGMLLVAALPPLVTRHGAGKLPLTAAFVNLGLFGMVTLGPTIGGLTDQLSAWRALFLAVAALGLGGFVVGWLAFEPAAAVHGMRFDWSAIPVAAAATALPFLAVSYLRVGGFGSPGFLVPLTLGLAALGTLLVRQYRKSEPLMPMQLVAHTLPVTGVAGAMVAGAAFTTLIEVSVVYSLDVENRTPLATGALLGSQLLGLVVAAWLFKVILPSRWVPLLAFTGIASIAVAGTLLLVLRPGGAALLIAGSLLGFGAGAGVAPGLFMGGLSVPSSRLGPTFALVELLRVEAAFLLAPVLIAVAMGPADLRAGLQLATLLSVVVVVVAGAGLASLLALGGKRLHAPDLSAWLDGEQPAYDSPRLFAVLRG